MDSKEVLKEYFGYDSFRAGQEDIINAILEKKDVLAIMPTGAGKSLCYQVPAMMLSGITVVISPLISLMQDQVKSLNDVGINAAYVNSTLSESEIDGTLNMVLNGIYKIIYIAPERLESAKFCEFSKQADISMVTVDEAHCISQWGQDFRPSYVKIVDYINSLPERPVVSAFTATATNEVKTDIECILQHRVREVVRWLPAFHSYITRIREELRQDMLNLRHFQYGIFHLSTLSILHMRQLQQTLMMLI